MRLPTSRDAGDSGGVCGRLPLHTYGARTFSFGQAFRDHASLRGVSHEEL